MFKCNKCRYTSNKFFMLCPKCKEGIGEELKEENNKNENKYITKIGNGDTNVLDKIHKVNINAKHQTSSRSTCFENFNAILSTSKGFIDGQMIAMGAEPGVGKSTLCTALASSDTLYISSEENYNQVNDRALRVNPQCEMDILNTTSFDEVCDIIRKTDKKLIIIDSLNSIEFGVGYATTARFAAELTNLIKEYNKICIMICQVTKSGEISGMQSLIHVVDTVLYLERSQTSKNIIATSSKNRFGEVGSVAIFQHKNNGFEEINVDHMDIKDEIGCTYTHTLFGHKNMTIAIESLVAPAQALYGIRNINGYNKNRLNQIIGILSYFGKIDFNNKDIYVAISNGLSTDDVSIELAIANSILSSYFNIPIIKEAYGDIKLNGKIINGNINGKEIKHISNLIELYRSNLH